MFPHHDHLREQLGDIDAQRHTGYYFLHRLQVALGVALHLWAAQEAPVKVRGVREVREVREATCK